jgi:hypothetical protein
MIIIVWFVCDQYINLKVTPIQSIEFDDDSTESKSLSATKLEKLVLPMLATVVVLSERLCSKLGRNVPLPAGVQKVCNNYLLRGVEFLDFKVEMPLFLDQMSAALGLREKKRVAKVFTYCHYEKSLQ